MDREVENHLRYRAEKAEARVGELECVVRCYEREALNSDSDALAAGLEAERDHYRAGYNRLRNSLVAIMGAADIGADTVAIKRLIEVSLSSVDGT
jgi:hypothetical protein